MTVRSIFSGIANPLNSFHSLDDLTTSVRNGIHIDTSVVPNAVSKNVPGYLYDYYIKPDFDFILDKYGKNITASDLEKSITEFTRNLKKISNSLKLKGPEVCFIRKKKDSFY